VELQVLVVKVVQRYRLEHHHPPVGLATSFVNRPDRQLKIRFVPRQE
jgi:hypothetical protein